MTIDNTADIATQTAKLIECTNEVVRLTQDLIIKGQLYNKAKGEYTEIKARIKAEKEKISSLKEIIKAEKY
jgi:hypothetical protein